MILVFRENDLAPLYRCDLHRRPTSWIDLSKFLSSRSSTVNVFFARVFLPSSVSSRRWATLEEMHPL